MSEQSPVSYPETASHCAILGSLSFPPWQVALTASPFHIGSMCNDFLLSYKNSDPQKPHLPTHRQRQPSLSGRFLLSLSFIFNLWDKSRG